MAKYKSPIISEINGKLGDMVFKKNQQGSYVSKNGETKNTTSEKQRESLNRFSQISNLWLTLNLEEIKLWEVLAKGKQIESKNKLQAINIFNKINMNLHYIGEEMLRVPPIITKPSMPTNVEMVIKREESTTDILLSVFPENGVDTKLVVYATGQKNLGVNFVRKEYRKVCILEYKDIAGLSLIQAYEERFGQGIIPNKKIFYKLESIHKLSGMDTYPIFGVVIT